MKKITLIIISFVLLLTKGLGQVSNPRDKIDPVFLSLIAQEKVAEKKSSTCIKRKKSTTVTAANVSSEKKYECIVYTKNAKLLRAKKITINTELPDFITAAVTLQQISQLSLMPEVTYIEAPRNNTLH